MSSEIPAYARRIVQILVGRRDQEFVLGDLTESYNRTLKQEGERVARRRLKHDVVRSIRPFVLKRLWQLVRIAVVLGRLVSWIHRQD